MNTLDKTQLRELAIKGEKLPNHKIGRRILTIISLPLIVLGIFFLYQIFICKIDSFDNLAGAIACGVGIAGIYFMELMLWLDETIARRRKRVQKKWRFLLLFLSREEWQRR